jgi:SpoIID/LytB domain protein
MKKIILYFGILAGAFICCMPPAFYNRPAESPHIRIGLVEEVDNLLFTAVGDLRVLDETGKPVGLLEAGDWQVRVVDGRPAEKLFFLKVLAAKDSYAAEEKMKDLKKLGYAAFSRTVGRKLTFNSRSIIDNRVFIVYLEQVFINQENAAEFQKKNATAFSAQIVKEYNGKASATIVFKNTQNNKIFQFSHTIRLTDNEIILRDVPVGEGFHWESKETRKYTGIIEFNLAPSARITIINELPIERYLRGVVPSEMPSTFPAEALKAQAVAVRTIALQKMGVAHVEQEFDVCDDVHCQAYRGVLAENAQTDLAVAGTYGIVVTSGSGLANTVYSAMCGGHTEAAVNVWNGDGADYLKGILDFSNKKYSTLGDYLKTEENVRKWLESEPTTFCNQKSASIPALAEGSRKYFRWRIAYSDTEFGEIISQKTGQKVGILKELIPLERGVSGRIKSLKVVGSSKTILLEGELKIRQALDRSTLFSSCFRVEKTADGRFGLIGAGFGHGVGMCQYGAAGMALKGKNFQDILKHYYPGTTLNSLY